MTLIELILTKDGKTPMFRYYPYNERHVVDIFKKAMLDEGWTTMEQDMSFAEYEEKGMASFLEYFAHRFYEKDREQSN